MYTATIKRKQLYLTDDLDEKLKQRASAEGRAEAAVVRDALDAYLAGTEHAGADPILALAGLAGGAPAPARQDREDLA